MIANIILSILVIVVSVVSLITVHKLKKNYNDRLKILKILNNRVHYLSDIRNLYAESYFGLAKEISTHSDKTNMEIVDSFSNKVLEERIKIGDKYNNCIE